MKVLPRQMLSVALMLSAMLTEPASAGGNFDGNWTIEDLRISDGMCTSIRVKELNIYNGLIAVSGHDPYIGYIVASGEVNGNGEASIDG